MGAAALCGAAQACCLLGAGCLLDVLLRRKGAVGQGVGLRQILAVPPDAWWRNASGRLTQMGLRLVDVSAQTCFRAFL